MVTKKKTTRLKTFELSWLDEVLMRSTVKAKSRAEAIKKFYKGDPKIFDTAKDESVDLIPDSLEVCEQ